MSERNNSLMTVLCLPKSSIWSSNLALHVNCCVVLMVAARRHVIFKGKHKSLFATPRHRLEGESKWPAWHLQGMSHLSAKKCSWFPISFYSRACVVYQWSVLFVLARAGHQLIATSTYSVIVTSVDEIQLQMLHRLSRIVLWRRQGVGVWC